MTIDAPKQEQIGQLRLLWKEAFGDTDAFLDSFFTIAFACDRCRCVTEDARVTAALYWFDCSCGGKKMAYLYAVATAKDRRGRGLCRALLEDTHAHLKKKGYAGTVLVPADDALRQMYGRMGYLPATTVAEFTCLAAEQEVPVRLLDKSEYLRLRRERLPAGAVGQEGPLADLLADQCGLFGGGDFLLAAWTEDGVLHAEEFLGDRAAVPGIVKALGAKRGVFRAPGGDKPFAMYRPLGEACPKPGYFGIALG